MSYGAVEDTGKMDKEDTGKMDKEDEWTFKKVSQRVVLGVGLLVMMSMATGLASKNILGLGMTSGVTYKIQQTHPIFEDGSSPLPFGRFPAVTICSNAVNSPACPNGSYRQCTRNQSILDIVGCRALRYSGGTYQEDPGYHCSNATPIASAESRYCVSLNNVTGGGAWRATTSNDRLRIFLRANGSSSKTTPWRGGFAYLHSAGLTAETVFSRDRSLTLFGVGRYHAAGYRLKRDFSSNLQGFKDHCLNLDMRNIRFEITNRESADLAEVDERNESEPIYRDIASLTVLSLGFHDVDPVLSCTIDGELNSVFDVLESIAGLLVIPEIGALSFIWLYLLLTVGCGIDSIPCCTWPASCSSSDTTTRRRWLVVAYAIIVLIFFVLTFAIGLTSLRS